MDRSLFFFPTLTFPRRVRRTFGRAHLWTSWARETASLLGSPPPTNALSLPLALIDVSPLWHSLSLSLSLPPASVSFRSLFTYFSGACAFSLSNHSWDRSPHTLATHRANQRTLLLKSLELCLSTYLICCPPRELTSCTIHCITESISQTHTPGPLAPSAELAPTAQQRILSNGCFTADRRCRNERGSSVRRRVLPCHTMQSSK